MGRARQYISLVCAVMLLLGAPGLGPWEAFAQTVARTVPAGAAAQVPALSGLRLPSGSHGLAATPQDSALGLPTALPSMTAPPALVPATGPNATARPYRPGAAVNAALPTRAATTHASASRLSADAALTAGTAADVPADTGRVLEGTLLELEATARPATPQGKDASARLRALFDGSRRGAQELSPGFVEDPAAPVSPEDGEIRRSLERIEEPPEASQGPATPEPSSPRPSGLRGAADLVREMAGGQKELRPLLVPYRKQMNVARALLIFKAVLNTALAYSVGALVDAAIAQTLPAAMLWLGAAAAVTVIKALNQRFYSVTSARVRMQVTRDFRILLFKGLLQSPAAKAETPAALASRLSQDVGRVTVKNVTIPIQFPHLVIQFALAAGFVVYSSPLIAALILGSLPLLGWLSWRYGVRASALQERASTQSADMTRRAVEILSAPPEGEPERQSALDRYARAVRRFARTMIDVLSLGAGFDALREILQAASTEILVLGVGLTSFILTGAPSVGQVMSLRGYAKDLRGAVDGLVDAYTDGKDAEGATRRILELLRAAENPKH